MKKYFRLFLIQQVLFCLLISFQIRGQNLVPNPSFEEFYACPGDYCQIFRATGWNSWGATPDYLNACNPWYSLSVPYNTWGYQYAADGNAYIAQYTYESDLPLREYSGIKLFNPLIIGKKYFASVKVSLPNGNGIKYATNKLGILFSTISFEKDTSFCNTDNPLAPRNFAHVFSDSIITDKINWTTISGSFIADSAYEYVVLGNFFDDENTSTIYFNNGCCGSIYFFDDVIVIEDTSSSSIDFFRVSSSLNLFSIYPNPTDEFIHIHLKKIIPVTLTISNSTGMNVFEQILTEQDNIINLFSFNPGIYFYHIESLQYKYTGKLILTPKN